MNLISDIRGRRQAFLIAISVTIAGIICTNLFMCKVFWLDPTIKTLSSWCYHSFSVDSVHNQFIPCVIPCVLISSVIKCGQKLLSFSIAVGIFVFIFRGVVSIFLGFFYLLKLNWFTFTIIFQLLPFAIVLIAFFIYLKESPEILMDKKLKNEAK